jgi:hypothetical protein
MRSSHDLSINIRSGVSLSTLTYLEESCCKPIEIRARPSTVPSRHSHLVSCVMSVQASRRPGSCAECQRSVYCDIDLYYSN